MLLFIEDHWFAITTTWFTPESPHLHCKPANPQIYCLGHGSLTRPASNASPILRDSFALKSSHSIYAVQFISIFCHFINSVVAKFYDRSPFLMPTQYGNRTQYFYRDTISRCLPTCPGDEDFILTGVKVLFK